MEVYGITYDHTTNYGSCFQAYALQTAIDKISIHNEKCEYKLIPLGNCIDWPGRVRFNPIVALHRNQFRHFEKKYMKYVDVDRMTDFPLLNNQADAFVCGSDVIWNPNANRSSGAFFLDFAKKYKFSYAASFGRTGFKDEYIQELKIKLSSFNDISCREASGCEIVSRAGLTAQLVLDPVFLLNSSEWDRLLKKKTHQDKYIFVYLTHSNEETRHFIDLLKEKTGLSVITSAWSTSPRSMIKQGIIQINKPEKWLYLLRNAEYVVTNSFHATAFSTVFHKKFYVVVHGEKDKGVNIRMSDLLNLIGLEKRIYNCVPTTLDLEEIDFSNTDHILYELCNESMKYLTRNMEAAYKQKKGEHFAIYEKL